MARAGTSGAEQHAQHQLGQHHQHQHQQDHPFTQQQQQLQADTRCQCSILLRLPRAQELEFWEHVHNSLRATAWDSVGALVAAANSRALAKSAPMASLAPQPLLFALFARSLSTFLVIQLLIMLLATRTYRRHRTAFALFNRLARFSTHVAFMLRPRAAPIPPPPPGPPGGAAPRHFLIVTLFTGPLSSRCCFTCRSQCSCRCS